MEKRRRTDPRWDLSKGNRNKWFLLRKRLNLTQRAVALALGKTRVTIYNYENDVWRPDTDTELRYAALALPPGATHDPI